MLSISLLCRQLKEIFKCSHISPLPHKENQLEENLDQFNTLVMIPVTEEGEGRVSEFLSTQIPSHFYFLLMFFWIPSSKTCPLLCSANENRWGKLCWKGLWRATEKRNMTTQCVTHQLAAATSPSTRHAAYGTSPWCLEEQADCRKGVQWKNSRFTCVSLKIRIKSGAAAQPTKEK